MTIFVQLSEFLQGRLVQKVVSQFILRTSQLFYVDSVVQIFQLHAPWTWWCCPLSLCVKSPALAVQVKSPISLLKTVDLNGYDPNTALIISNTFKYCKPTCFSEGPGLHVVPTAWYSWASQSRSLAIGFSQRTSHSQPWLLIQEPTNRSEGSPMAGLAQTSTCLLGCWVWLN